MLIALTGFQVTPSYPIFSYFWASLLLSILSSKSFCILLLLYIFPNFLTQKNMHKMEHQNCWKIFQNESYSAVRFDEYPWMKVYKSPVFGHIILLLSCFIKNLILLCYLTFSPGLTGKPALHVYKYLYLPRLEEQ